MRRLAFRHQRGTGRRSTQSIGSSTTCAACGGRDAVGWKKCSARDGSDWRSARVEQLEKSESRAWKAIEALAKKQEKLDDALVVLIEAQSKTDERFQQVGPDMKEGFRETDARIAALSANLDERIGKLVSAIGDLVRRDSGAK
jgi:hypothetical protein